LIISRIKDEDATAILFNDKANELIKSNGGYFRINRFVPRVGDATKMAIIELVLGDDVGYSKSKKCNISKAKVARLSKVTKEKISIPLAMKM
jgi:hypothetical protein